MTERLALRDFLYSHDGLNALQAVAGEIVDLPDAAIAGLESEGYVARPDGSTERKVIDAAPSATEPVAIDPQSGGAPNGPDFGEQVGDFEPVQPGDIPLEWESLHWKQRVKLAEELTGQELTGEDLSGQANAIIARVVAERAEAQVR